MMLNAPNILDAINRMKAADPDFKLFGAEMHRYELHPALSEDAVDAFESRYGIKLPGDYRRYLIEISNGGAGPAYGIFRLGEVDANFSYTSWSPGDGMVGTLSATWPHSIKWNDLTGWPDEDLEDDHDAYDKAIESFDSHYFDSRLIDGAIPICHEGCAIRDYLVVAGNEAGAIWVDARASNEGIYPATVEGKDRVTFSDWYMHWLEESLKTLGL